MNVYKVGADIGDAIAGLAVCRHLGRGHVRLYSTPHTKGFSDVRYNALVPLIEGQEWAESVARFDEKEGLVVTHDFSDFRTHWGKHPHLIGKQAVCVGVDPSQVSIEPWIKIPPSPKHNKIVICRSTRCKGAFHWFRLWQVKAKDCIFLGLEEDYKNFCDDNCPWMARQVNKRPIIEFRPTANLLEAAMVIAGSRLFICNQTSLLWVAYATGASPLMIEQISDDSYLAKEGRRFVRFPQDNLSMEEFTRL